MAELLVRPGQRCFAWEFAQLADVRDQTSIDHDPSLELDKIRVFAVRARELADLRAAPAVQRDLKRDTGRQARHEARHDGDPRGAVDVGQLYVGHDMAGNLELFQGYL
jgi:hypothetical protein